MGELITPRAWCRQRWCREDPNAAHRVGDGCSCDGHGRAAAAQARFVRLTAKAARLAAFACRACGTNTRRVVEYPDLFFRCEPCAADDRWPAFPNPGARGG
jgi:hypothetical protein